VTVKEGVEQFELEQLDEPPYQGSPVVVEMVGTWCNRCWRASQELKKLYEEYHPKGLAVIGLNYELTENKEYNRKKTREFKNKNDLPWEMVAVHGDLDSFLEIIPKELRKVRPGGFPFAVYLNRDHSIAAVEAGFPTKETGQTYKKHMRRQRRYIEKILESSAP
jgi:thiol-disulfide isomerase/thioredoxin